MNDEMNDDQRLPKQGGPANVAWWHNIVVQDAGHTIKRL